MPIPELVERQYLICPCCGRQLEEGDGEESPPLYCWWCEIGWDTPEEAIDFGARWAGKNKAQGKELES